MNGLNLVMANKRTGIDPQVASHRVSRLQDLIAEYGTAVALSKAHGIDSSYISQLITRHRSFGEKAVSNIETAINRPGYFDSNSTAHLSPAQAELADAAKLAGQVPDEQARLIAALIRSSTPKT